MGNLGLNLALGGGRRVEKANVQYTGKARAIPDAMQYGGGLEFDGVGTYVDTACELVDGDDYTLCATVTPTSVVSTDKNILNYYYGAGIRIESTNSTLTAEVMLADGATSVICSSSIVVAPGECIRVIASVRSNIDVRIYISGNLVGTENLTQHTGRLNGRSFIVSRNGTFNGTLTNVQIWNHAFTQSDVEYDFANQSTTADTRTGTELTRANLKGHWKLDEQWGTVAEDSSDYGNDGTLVGFGDREYPRLRDTGKKPLDNAVLYSGQALDFDSVDDRVVIGDISW